ncbi:glycosyltransferase family 4 protein [Roseitranquillus sediminis]|uniref:glycosyltransferase family 4 protein n=1 Tax=Roseitranquillus sediminis TaxID=2809051 RepID=UPI001D0CD06B|nr:glycosyltransferase family 4 protein [Roseitranquillus sediminis]MBM9593231.1 glycosyltransferase family 4 protein [Roseitranquillus sediminis]
MEPRPEQIDVLAPNLKRRLSGVTATVVRLIPVQNKRLGVWATGPGLPPGVPHVPLVRAATLPGGPRVWHARRNTEMVLGLILRNVLRRDLRLLFTSAAQRRHTRFTRWLIERMDAVVATSPQAAAYLERPAEVVMHGVDTEAFRPAPDKASLRNELELEPGTWVGCFGRVRHQKGTDVLVEAMLRLMPDRPDLRCLIVGRPDDTAFREELQRKVAAAGLAGRLRWVAHLPWDALTRHYAAMDVYAAPQRWEGFGLTPLEAMASGVPVVATTVGAFPALVRDGETGRLVPPDDPEAFTDAMRALVDTPEERLQMARAARAHVEARFGIEREAEALIAVYRRLLGR